MIACRLLGHRWRFAAEDEEMRWRCERGCGAGGAKRYPSAADASRYAEALDRDASPTRGRRFTLSTSPLLLFRRRR